MASLFSHTNFLGYIVFLPPPSIKHTLTTFPHTCISFPITSSVSSPVYLNLSPIFTLPTTVSSPYFTPFYRSCSSTLLVQPPPVKKWTFHNCFALYNFSVIYWFCQTLFLIFFWFPSVLLLFFTLILAVLPRSQSPPTASLPSVPVAILPALVSMLAFLLPGFFIVAPSSYLPLFLLGYWKPCLALVLQKASFKTTGMLQPPLWTISPT